MGSAEMVDPGAAKRLQMDRLVAEARGFGLELAEVNGAKPWGGYLRFTQDSLASFLSAYWRDVEVKLPDDQTSVDPKVLLVAPNEILSLQWHRRRAELWRVIDGPVRIVMGDGWDGLAEGLKDRDPVFQTGEVVHVAGRQWHRLIGLEGWGRVAEIWQHTDPDRPSDEEDIVREHDLYDRAEPEADKQWRRVYPY